MRCCLIKLDGKVPIIDVMAISFKVAEIMVDLKRALGLPPLSRAGRHQRLSEEDLIRIRAHFGLA